jgi:WD40 repeat protein/3',5'-cyclic AMP phosphodiesterase CpdA
VSQGDHATASRPIDFFVSYSPADERWATWVAWELETAGYSTMLQAWDFVPGTNFIDFMDRGVSEASAVIALLSRNYLRSRYGRLEWQAALRADPEHVTSRLVTVRIEDCPLDGLLSMITYVDLVGVEEPARARQQLLRRIEEALAGRAKPAAHPGFPAHSVSLPSTTRQDPVPRPRSGPGRNRRAPVTAPVYPPAAPAASGRSALTVLHLPGPRFGRGLVADSMPSTGAELQERIWGDLTRLAQEGAPGPDLLVVTGDLTESGSVREFGEAREVLTGLRVLLGLEPHRVVVVPGRHDVSWPACRAYFATCEADDVEPRAPYWPKWRHFVRLFEDLYQGLDDLVFDSQQPWTLFAMPDLRLVVAGLNSTMRESHRPDDHYGWIGEAQAAWFAERLRPFVDAGWLRLGALNHDPVPPDPAGRPGPAGLRDAATLDRLLGTRLNAVLAGAGSSGEVELLPSGLAVLPPLADNRHQLLQLSTEGVVRWPGRHLHDPDNGAGPERVSRRWHAADATFRTTEAAGTGQPDARQLGALSAADPSAEPAAGTAGDPPADPTQAADPVDLLLDRITEVCRTRYDNPKIRRVAGRPPHLLITSREDGFVRQQLVAAHVGELRQADLEAFLGQVYATEAELASELVYQGPPVSQALREEAFRRGVHLRSFLEFQGLLDLRDFVVRQTARLRSDPLYPPELYVPQRYRELSGGDLSVHSGLTDELLRLLGADSGRFILILGDFGRGKTFALREVASRVPTELPYLVPILIELRSLDKAHSVDALVAAHLASHDEERIDIRAFNYMLREGRIVLLFDGFDELATRVTYERAADHLDTLLAAVQGKAKIVVSSRTQHFRTDAQVLTALGERVGVLPTRRVFTIEDFSAEQIRAYLVNRYGGDEAAADVRMRLLSGTHDLLGLAQNPRMLNFVANLDEERLRAVAEAGQVASASRLYEEILTAWLGHEEQRTGAVHGAPGGLTLEELWQAVTTLAVRLWESNEPMLQPADLVEVLGTLSALAGSQLTPQQRAHAVGAGSLLVRTEDGLFGFIHGSVVEWLVARDIARTLSATAAVPLLSARPLSALSVDFLCDLVDPQACQTWLRGVLADPEADDIARVNALKISTRLRVTGRADLRGAMLRGEDLSRRDLSDADLAEADLTDARLVGTNLARANLRGATLAGARLDEAILTGADLTGADLTRALLPRTDLRDVVLTGSRWRQAALINVTARPELFRAPELAGAAVTPGQPLEAELAPAAIGVAYGFEIGRIPQPLAYSADGGILAIGSDDGGVLLCDTTSGLPLRTLHGHRDRVYATVFGHRAAILVTGSSDGTVGLWDPTSGRRRQRLEGHRDWVWPMELSPDDTLLATGDSTGTVRLWEVADGRLRHGLAGHAERVWTAQFQPGGPLLATGDDSGALRLWDTADGQPAGELSGHGGAVYRVAFSPDGELLASSDHAGMVRIWDVERRTVRHELAGHHRSVYTIAFSPAGDLLVTGDTAGAVRLWDPATGRGRGRLVGHTGAVYWAAFSPDGSQLAIGGSEEAVTLWDPATGQPYRTLTGHKGSTWPTAFRPDGGQLATSSSDGTTRLWEPGSGHCRRVLRGHGRRITSVQFSPDGETLATSGNDGIVRLWSPYSGQRLRELAGIADRLISAFFAPVGPVLATASNDGGVYLWNAATGEFERELNVETDHVWAAVFSPDGDVLATANDDDTVRLFYRTTGRRVRVLGEHRGRVRSIAFSRDGTLLATGCDDRAVRLWDAQAGEQLATLTGHTDRVYSVVFDADGSRLASASNDGTARIWDPGSGRVLHTLGRPGGRLWSAAFSPDGTLLATAGDDLVVRLWDTHTGRRLDRLVGHTRRVWSVSFSPDGSRLASAGDDGTVRVWDLADRAKPELRMTLLGLPDGWAALSPDGRYKLEGDAAGEFWHVIGLARFEPGDVDAYLPEVRRLAPAAVF